MSSQLPQNNSDKTQVTERRAWSRPAFNRFETGEAEAVDGPGSDSASMNS
jgi:hypothetical protein